MAKNIDYYEIRSAPVSAANSPAWSAATTVLGLWAGVGAKRPADIQCPILDHRGQTGKPVRINGSMNWSTRKGISCRIFYRSTRPCTGPTRLGVIPARDTRGTGSDAPTRGQCRWSRTSMGRTPRKRAMAIPEAWYLPACEQYPRRVCHVQAPIYDYFNANSQPPWRGAWVRATRFSSIPTDQRATTLWYHDHTLGMTRLNVYAGPAGFYLIRGGPDDTVLDSRHRCGGRSSGPCSDVGEMPPAQPTMRSRSSFRTARSTLMARLFFPG